MALSTLLANTGDPTAAGAAGTVVYAGAVGVVAVMACGGDGDGEGGGDAGRLMACAHNASTDSGGAGA